MSVNLLGGRPTDTVTLVLRNIHKNRSPFGLDAFLERCNELPRRHELRISGTVQADLMANCIVLDPAIPITRAVRMTILIGSGSGGDNHIAISDDVSIIKHRIY